MSLFKQPDERAQATVIVAGLAFHALISAGSEASRGTMEVAFNVAREFLARADLEMERQGAEAAHAKRGPALG